ncbi:MAG: methyl-accepting chemotaxis protein, partial [Janthinobacterium lividum]
GARPSARHAQEEVTMQNLNASDHMAASAKAAVDTAMRDARSQVMGAAPAGATPATGPAEARPTAGDAAPTPTGAPARPGAAA